MNISTYIKITCSVGWISQMSQLKYKDFVLRSAACMITDVKAKWRATTNIRDIHYHKENKTNGGKQIEFSAENNQFEKKNQKWE